MKGLFNWFSQIASIAKLNLQTIGERKGSTAAAVVGIAGVAAVLVGVLSIGEGFRRTLTVSAMPDVAIVLRSGATSEMMSGLSRADTRIIGDAPGVARRGAEPLASAELFVIIDLPKRSTGTAANVPLRGVETAAFEVRKDLKIIQGRRFEAGRNEVIVGQGAAIEFAGLDLGSKFKVGQNEWAVVGIFTAGGGLAESEIWTDARVLQPAYRRGDSFQAVHAKLTSEEAFDQFKDALTTDPRLNLKVVRQTEYYAEQSSLLHGMITGLGIGIACLMSLGALFGALNTMYTAVSARTREIATLRALGFGSGAVMISILLESLFLALLGGIIGAGAAYLAFDGYRATTMNWGSFSQVAFAFTVTPTLLAGAIVLAIGIGFWGGFFPALRAARLPIARALREW